MYKQSLCEMIKKFSKIDNINLDKNVNPIDDLGLDSFSMVMLIVEIESKYNIEFDDNDLNLEILSSTDKILDIIKKKKGKLC